MRTEMKKKIMGQIIENQYLSVSRTLPHLFLLLIFPFFHLIAQCCMYTFHFQQPKKIFHKSLFFSFFFLNVIFFRFSSTLCFFLLSFLFFFCTTTHIQLPFFSIHPCVYIHTM